MKTTCKRSGHVSFRHWSSFRSIYDVCSRIACGFALSSHRCNLLPELRSQRPLLLWPAWVPLPQRLVWRPPRAAISAAARGLSQLPPPGGACRRVNAPAATCWHSRRRCSSSLPQPGRRSRSSRAAALFGLAGRAALTQTLSSHSFIPMVVMHARSARALPAAMAVAPECSRVRQRWHELLVEMTWYNHALYLIDLSVLLAEMHIVCLLRRCVEIRQQGTRAPMLHSQARSVPSAGGVAGCPSPR